MSDVRDPASMIEAAQKAVGDGDYPAAERLLREAAAIQKASLGSSHPDLATTLNNLAFVYERTGNMDEAERGYRRAHAIAVASLSPGHPFIKTSLSNLVEFCAARGIPIWTPPAAPIEDEPLLEDADIEPLSKDADVKPLPEDANVEFLPEDADVEPVIEAAPELLREPNAGSRVPLRMMAGAAVVLAIILVIVFTRQGQGTGRTEVPQSVARARTETVPPAPVPPAPVAPAPATPATAPSAAPARPRAPESTVTTKPRREPVKTTANTSVTVLKAQLCSALAKRGSPDWQCTPASGDLRPGTYMFYTRLLAAASTTVEHRWYFGGRAHQTMRLRVTASPGNGYRTFSATTVSPQRAGDWKVELRAADGSLLQEERFVVR